MKRFNPGMKFGRLILLKPSQKRSGTSIIWFCQCECGNHTSVPSGHLGSGHTKSCGCLALATRTKHGETSRTYPYTAEYICWQNMIQRCTNSNRHDYYLYGARGIKVCKKWLKSFSSFLLDVGRKPTFKHSLDRINNEGNYEPKNVRWATSKEQQANRRNSGSSFTKAV